jgi:hypothetical protein
LSGHSGHSQTVGGVSLPDVEGPMGGSRQVDGSACPLATTTLIAGGWVE